MLPRHINTFRQAIRTESSGNLISETITLVHPFTGEPGKQRVLMYGDVPVLWNNYIPVTAQGSTTETAPIYAIKWDRGDKRSGLAGITSKGRGIEVIPGGRSETNYGDFYHLMFYANQINYEPRAQSKWDAVKFTLT